MNKIVMPKLSGKEAAKLYKRLRGVATERQQPYLRLIKALDMVLYAMHDVARSVCEVSEENEYLASWYEEYRANVRPTKMDELRSVLAATLNEAEWIRAEKLLDEIEQESQLSKDLVHCVDCNKVIVRSHSNSHYDGRNEPYYRCLGCQKQYVKCATCGDEIFIQEAHQERMPIPSDDEPSPKYYCSSCAPDY